jgi:hypothetical protein
MQLKKLKPVIEREYGVEKFAVFGSQTRNDYTEKSDVDIAIVSMKKKSFDNFMDLKYFLESKLDQKVDLGFYDSMKNFIKNEIKKDMIYV